MTPNLAILEGADANRRRADQLAELVLSFVEGLRQGPRYRKHPSLGPLRRRRRLGQVCCQSIAFLCHLFIEVCLNSLICFFSPHLLVMLSPLARFEDLCL